MIQFTKMQGLGNDYVYFDAIHQEIKDVAHLARFASDRHFGVGGDGIILICQSQVADFKMRMFNCDGSEAEMCGNGIRCVGKFVYDKGLTQKTEITVETLAGIKYLELQVENGKVQCVKVDMGEPILEPKKIPVEAEQMPVLDLPIQVEGKAFSFACVSMGNPHAITIVEDVDSFEVEKYGKEIEVHPVFPRKTNVEFIQVVDKKQLKMRVWERGTGETLACGTGACASAVACNLLGIADRCVEIELLGGKLQIEWNEENNHVYMTGPAVTVFDGVLEGGEEA